MLAPVQLGKSGLQVSRLGLGTMNFGVLGQGNPLRKYRRSNNLIRDIAATLLDALINRSVMVAVQR
jgi:aryl-alcohol dehydrogenase-like predicted oxidoreductase